MHADVIALVREYWGDPEYVRKTIFFRTSYLLFGNGVKVAFNENEHEGEPVVLECPATALETLAPVVLLNFLRVLRSWDFRATRIDESFDDFEWIVTPQEVYREALAGNCAGYKKVNHAGGADVGSGRDNNGFTCYLGTRGQNGSGKFGRIYDKNAESEGEINAVRWEVEWTDAKARFVFAQLAACVDVESFCRVLASHVGGAFDFPIRNGDPNLDRLPRLAWWVKLRELLGVARIRVEREKPTYESMKGWLETVLPRQLAVVREVEGWCAETECAQVHGKFDHLAFMRFLNELADQGLADLTPKYRRMRDQAMKLRSMAV